MPTRLRKLLAGLAFLMLPGLAEARPITPQEQVVLHDFLIVQEEGAWNSWVYLSTSATEASYWLGRGTGLGECASLVYLYNDTETLGNLLIKLGGIMDAMAEAEENPYQRAWLHGMAAGYNQAGNNILNF